MNYELPPMRTIKQAVAEIKEYDKDSPIGEWALRQLVINGDIPSVKFGKKYLINMNILSKYLYEGTKIEEQSREGTIRMVKG